MLLRHLWATDGCIAVRRGRGPHSVYYATNSQGLAFDVAALLLRFGIVARIGTATKGGYRPGFHVRVSGTTDQRAFVREVGAYGPKVFAAAALAEAPGAAPAELPRTPGPSRWWPWVIIVGLALAVCALALVLYRKHA